jgi:hypothetical protein
MGDSALISKFIDERCIIDPILQVNSTKLYTTFLQFISKTDPHCRCTHREFACIVQKTYTKQHSRSGNIFIGLDLKEEARDLNDPSKVDEKARVLNRPSKARDLNDHSKGGEEVEKKGEEKGDKKGEKGDEKREEKGEKEKREEEKKFKREREVDEEFAKRISVELSTWISLKGFLKTLGKFKDYERRDDDEIDWEASTTKYKPFLKLITIEPNEEILTLPFARNLSPEVSPPPFNPMLFGSFSPTGRSIIPTIPAPVMPSVIPMSPPINGLPHRDRKESGSNKQSFPAIGARIGPQQPTMRKGEITLIENDRVRRPR